MGGRNASEYSFMAWFMLLNELGRKKEGSQLSFYVSLQLAEIKDLLVLVD